MRYGFVQVLLPLLLVQVAIFKVGIVDLHVKLVFILVRVRSTKLACITP